MSIACAGNIACSSYETHISLRSNWIKYGMCIYMYIYIYVCIHTALGGHGHEISVAGLYWVAAVTGQSFLSGQPPDNYSTGRGLGPRSKHF